MKLKWVVEFQVDSTWVADGFDLTDDRALDMLAGDLRHAFGMELKAKVLKAPDALMVAKLQGYKDAKKVRQVRKDGKR